MKPKLIIIMIWLVLLTACTGANTQAAVPFILQTPVPSQTPNPTPTPMPTPIPGKYFGHIVLIVMENTSIDTAVQSPYFQQLMQQYAYAKSYYSVFHPSLPNYIALASGDTHGFSTDCVPGQDCSIPGSGNSIGDELTSAGITWKAYLESMTQPCATSNEGNYAVRHNPFVYFDNIRNDPRLCATHDVPFDQLQTDINQKTLPQFAWVVPNDCNNMHTQCDQNKTVLQQGADWLSTWVPKILASQQMQSDGVLVITFDEGTGSSGCCGADPGGGQVLTLVISPNSLVKVGGFSSDTAYNHYSLLRTIEDNWGLGYLGHSGDDGIVPMTDFFTGSK